MLDNEWTLPFSCFVWSHYFGEIQINKSQFFHFISATFFFGEIFRLGWTLMANKSVSDLKPWGLIPEKICLAGSDTSRKFFLRGLIPQRNLFGGVRHCEEICSVGLETLKKYFRRGLIPLPADTPPSQKKKFRESASPFEGTIFQNHLYVKTILSKAQIFQAERVP